jgi:hypothetical protein
MQVDRAALGRLGPQHDDGLLEVHRAPGQRDRLAVTATEREQPPEQRRLRDSRAAVERSDVAQPLVVLFGRGEQARALVIAQSTASAPQSSSRGAAVARRKHLSRRSRVESRLNLRRSARCG